MHLCGSLCSMHTLQSKGFSIKPAGIGFTLENLPCGIRPPSQELLSACRAQANIFFRLNMFWLRQRQVSIGCGGNTGSVRVPNDIAWKLNRAEKDQSVQSGSGSFKIHLSSDWNRKDSNVGPFCQNVLYSARSYRDLISCPQSLSGLENVEVSTHCVIPGDDCPKTMGHERAVTQYEYKGSEWLCQAVLKKYSSLLYLTRYFAQTKGMDSCAPPFPPGETTWYSGPKQFKTNCG